MNIICDAVFNGYKRDTSSSGCSMKGFNNRFYLTGAEIVFLVIYVVSFFFCYILKYVEEIFNDFIQI